MQQFSSCSLRFIALPAHLFGILPFLTSGIARYGVAALVCVAAALLVLPFHAEVDLAMVVSLFLLVVVIVAVVAGRGPAVLASLGSVALFDFFFVPPRFSFAVSQVQHVLTFLVMLAVSLSVGELTAGLRIYAQEAARRERDIRALYALAKELAGAPTVEQVRQAVAMFVAQRWQGQAELFGPEQGLPSGAEAWDGQRRVLHFPLEAGARQLGVFKVRLPGTVEGAEPLLKAIVSLVSTALERLHCVEVAQAARLEAESERLRSSLLSAISHDVRTPLTVLFGMADGLVLASAPLPAEVGESARAIRDQAFRLNGMVANLLDMARLQTGRIQLRREWLPIEEVVGASAHGLGSLLVAHPLRTTGLAALPLLEVDAVLLERVFCNLFENAAKYSPPGAPILLSAATTPSCVKLAVCNAGDGFAPEHLNKVFELFERGGLAMPVEGFGMGLAICRAIVQAHGGSIRAFNPPTGGACVEFELPRGCPPGMEAGLVGGDEAEMGGCGHG